MQIVKCFVNQPDKHELEVVVSSMALFGIKVENGEQADWVDQDVNRLPDQAIFLHNSIDNRERIRVRTNIVFHGEKILNHFRFEHVTDIDVGENRISAIKRLIRLNILEGMKQITGHDPGPWGILRGVRPTKIAHCLLDRNLKEEQVCCLLQENYALTSSKAKLLTDIAAYQRPFLLSSDKVRKFISVYIGIPYCPTRCLYCSFPAYTLPAGRQIAVFLEALKRDIQATVALIKQYGLAVQNIYIGGGTPTSLMHDDFAWLLRLVRDSFVMSTTREFTVEAGRPDSINDEKIMAMCQYGVNRVSVNPQTMQQKTLNRIGRMHSVQDIISVFLKMRQCGLFTINMDVIAGLPGETETDFIDTMDKIQELQPDNLTVHTLAIKKGSRLKEKLCQNIDYKLPSELVTNNMLAIAQHCTRQLGMKPYYLYRQKYMTGNLENVGYTVPGKECLYNIQIMEERQTIIGVGPAASTKVVNPETWRLVNFYNAKDVSAYISNVNRYIDKRKQVLSSLLSHKEESD